MKRITKLLGSLAVSAALMSATATAYADTTEITAQQTEYKVTGFTAEITENGTKISWDTDDNVRFAFLLRETNGNVSDFWLFSAEDNSYIDTSAPNEECVYYIQMGVTINGVDALYESDRVTVTPALRTEVSEKMDAKLTIGNGKAVLNWNNTGASGYIVAMDGKTVYDTKSGDVTSYIAAIANYSKHTFTVSSYSESSGTRTVLEESAPMITTDLDTILNSARTSQTRSFTITNRQTAAVSAGSRSLSDHDIAVIEKFAAEHFTAGMSDAQKLQTALTWINRNVKYAATSADWGLINNKSYADAIFTYQRGQCAQYNGAMVSLMRYLGYDADMVLGWRGNSYSRWQHYWGEVEVDGLRFIIEAGNYGASGSWSYLLVPYSRTDGRFIMYG